MRRLHEPDYGDVFGCRIVGPWYFLVGPQLGGLSAMKPNEYKCAACGGVFEKGWSDEEALAELDATFGVPVEDCALVCDDCYREMGLAE
jgi:hypothetical protein